jgi:hypothetical protein
MTRQAPASTLIVGEIKRQILGTQCLQAAERVWRFWANRREPSRVGCG